MDIENEFKLLKDYMNIYVQYLYPLACKEINKPQIPTFKEYKNDIKYFETPTMKESKDVCSKQICNIYTHGLGSDEGIATRYYKIFRNVKYFTGGNITGNYTINTDKLNQILKLN